MFKNTVESGSQKTLGEVYFLKGEFAASVDYLQNEKKNYLQTNKLRLYYNSCNMLLRAYLEMNDEVNLKLVKQELQNIVIKEDSEMTSRLYYTLGINAFLDSKKDQALKWHSLKVTKRTWPMPLWVKLFGIKMPKSMKKLFQF